jgi:hypothetical protein
VLFLDELFFIKVNTRVFTKTIMKNESLEIQNSSIDKHDFDMIDVKSK